MNEHRSTWLILVLVISLSSLVVFAANADEKPAGKFGNETAEQTAQRMKWFTDARFGMFIHWGPVALKGSEIGWSRGTEVPAKEYDSLYKNFTAELFDAADWVLIAKAAGMKYIVLTAKHHDGFSLWDTKLSDYNIMNAPLGRDVVKELAAECRKHGIVFCTYYTILDWYHPDYTLYAHGGPGFKLPEGQTPDMNRFIKYMKGQLKELIENYGPLGIIWFDGEWEEPWTADMGDDMYDYIRTLQPSIIINNRVGKGRHGMAGTTAQTKHNPGDYDTPEQRVGAFQNQRPWETCMTICQQWAWKPNDKMKSAKQCIQTLLRTVGGDGNLLFNVGPMPDGRIEPRQVERLMEMGQWLEAYGHSVYGTRGGPFKPGMWGVSTHKGTSVYVHVMTFSEESVTLPPIDRKIEDVKLLTGGTVTYTQSAEGIILTVPEAYHDDIATIIELVLDGSAFDIEPVALPSLSLTVGKEVAASNVYMKQVAMFGAQQACDGDNQTRWATDSGTKMAWLEVDLLKPETFTQAIIKEAYAGRVTRFELQKLNGEKWETFHIGTTLGQSKLMRFDSVTAQKVRLNILEASDGPTISEFQLLK